MVTLRALALCSCLALPLSTLATAQGWGGEAAAPAATATPAPAPAPLSADDKLLVAARAASSVYRRHVADLVAKLASKDEAVRVSSISHLGHLQDPTLVPTLMDWAQAPIHTPAEIIAAATALGSMGAQAAVPALHALLAHEDSQVRAAVMNALTQLKQLQAVDYKAHALDTDDAIRASSMTELGSLVQTDAAGILVAGLDTDSRPYIRRMCAISLGYLDDKTQGPALITALSDPDPGVRRYAAEALVRLHYTQAIPNMLLALDSNIAGDHINQCVMLLSGQDFGYNPAANSFSRDAAIETGFQWWAAHEVEVSK